MKHAAHATVAALALLAGGAVACAETRQAESCLRPCETSADCSGALVCGVVSGGGRKVCHEPCSPLTETGCTCTPVMIGGYCEPLCEGTDP